MTYLFTLPSRPGPPPSYRPERLQTSYSGLAAAATSSAMPAMFFASASGSP